MYLEATRELADLRWAQLCGSPGASSPPRSASLGISSHSEGRSLREAERWEDPYIPSLPPHSVAKASHVAEPRVRQSPVGGFTRNRGRNAGRGEELPRTTQTPTVAFRCVFYFGGNSFCVLLFYLHSHSNPTVYFSTIWSFLMKRRLGVPDRLVLCTGIWV